MRALVLETSTSTVSLRDWPKPVPGPGEVLVRVEAIALNPVDELYVSNPIAIQDHRVIGTDFAGTVAEVNEELDRLTDPRTRKGTRVAGFVQGACSVNDRPGAFAEYVAIPYDLLWVVPQGMSLQAAATISMCGLTAAQAVFTRLNLPGPGPLNNSSQRVLPSEGGVTNVFIYGASTSLGLYIAQLVRASFTASGQKLRLIGTASSSKHEFLRKAPYSYDVLVDYRDAVWAEKVREATGGTGVAYAFDTISEGDTVSQTHDTLASHAKFAVFRGPVGGRYDPHTMRIKPEYGAVWVGLGEEIKYNGAVLPSDPEARDFATRFYKYLSSGVDQGNGILKPNPVRLMPGGLDRVVPDGFTLFGSGTVSARPEINRVEDYMRPISGEKLVYTL